MGQAIFRYGVRKGIEIGRFRYVRFRLVLPQAGPQKAVVHRTLVLMSGTNGAH